MFFPSLLPVLALLSATAVANPLANRHANPQHQSTDAAAAYCPRRPAGPGQQKEIFAAFVNTMYTNKEVTTAFNRHVDVALIEHGPYDPQGRDAMAAKLETIIPFADFSVERWNFDNGFGVVHMRVNGDPETAIIDIYRMDGTCLVEHWDITQTWPADATNAVGFF